MRSKPEMTENNPRYSLESARYGVYKDQASICHATETEDCSGGTAACKDKAVCEICGAPYGEINTSNPSNFVKTEVKPETRLEAGNRAYCR